jgi:hypothetical protein
VLHWVSTIGNFTSKIANPNALPAIFVWIDANNLSGELPQEFCCLPCVENVTMANNKIGGPILSCLVAMPTLKAIDFTNNSFSSFGFSETRPMSVSPP